MPISLFSNVCATHACQNISPCLLDHLSLQSNARVCGYIATCNVHTQPKLIVYCLVAILYQQISVINTKGRAAKVDGRYVHWVRGFDFAEGDRFSIIYYKTRGCSNPRRDAVLEWQRQVDNSTACTAIEHGLLDHP